jgi:hypothetical protein
MEIVGELGVVATSFIVPNRLALVVPVAVICTLAENVFTCWVCWAARVRIWPTDDADAAVPRLEPLPDEELKLLGLHPAIVTAAATATAAKPSGRATFNCGNTPGPPRVGDC